MDKVKDKRPASAEKRVIDIDTDLKKVLDWDNKGYAFQYDFDRFQKFDDEVIKKLSHKNREGYFIAQGVARKLEEQEEERKSGFRRTEGPKIGSVGDKLELNLIGGSATGRTTVKDGRKDTHYCLKRAGELGEAVEAGYDFVDSSDPVKTPGMAQVAGSRRISSHGEDELVLMKIPEEKYQKHIHAVSDISSGKITGARKGFESEGQKRKKYHLEFWDKTKKKRVERENSA